MKSLIKLTGVVIIASGCASTKVAYKYPNLPVVQDELNTSKWNQLVRFPARYPKQAAMKSIQGCATVEYVITPQNDIKDIKIVKSTNKVFDAAATEVVEKWKWSEFPKYPLTHPVKTQTRFEFCFDTPEQSCAAIDSKYSCPGEDVIFSSGRLLKVKV